MVFKVSVAHGLGRLAATFPTEAQALGEARNQIEHHATDIRIQIMETGEEFTFEQFRAKMIKSGVRTPLG